MRDLDLLGQMEAENERLERKVGYWRDKAKESAAEIEVLREACTDALQELETMNYARYKTLEQKLRAALAEDK
jgi:hypothetical protein